MKGKLRHPERPYGRDDCQLVAAGREGTYWQAADGLVVRLATPERPAVVHYPDAPAREPLMVLGYAADAVGK
jgi:hypothetical protein